MRRRSITIAIAMLPAFAAAQSGRLAPELGKQLDALLASPDPRSGADAFWRACSMRYGRVQPAIDALRDLIDEPNVAEPMRLAAIRLSARLLRRRGDLPSAATELAGIVVNRESKADTLEKAEVFDALGRDTDALAAYDRLLARGVGVELETTILVRKALIESLRSTGRESPLADFAARKDLPVAVRNQAAIVLALLDRPEAALELFTVTGEGSKRFRQQVRLAEWAIAAGDLAKARAHAWDASRSARLRRDRRYALTLLADAYRRDKKLPELIEKLASTAELDRESRGLWVDLLRETGRVGEALRLFGSAAGGGFTIEMRRDLLDMCRETGRDATLIDAYRKSIREQPQFLEWREGLARFFLERGDRPAAVAVWEPFLGLAADDQTRLAAAATLMDLGLDDLAVRFARAAHATEMMRDRALVFLFELYRDRGKLDDARSVLAELEGLTRPDAAVRRDVADAYERIGALREAVATLDAYCKARGDRVDTDMRMKLALLLSQVGDEDAALEHWQLLWRDIDSVPRRRYVEQRLMTVAARLGKLARVAIGLEQKLAAGKADDRDAGLLVRIYIRANDPVSATEVVEEHLKKTGKSAAAVLAEKARVFQSCNDYYNYERVMRELVEVDADNRVDHLRELAMSCMERGQRLEARHVLDRLRDEDTEAESDEFEAGLLALAGMRREAAVAYRKTLAEHPGRIDTYLLLSNLLRDMGQRRRATGMFQFLAAKADKDDLFTVAIDGVLNMRGQRGQGVPDRIVAWARRTVLERIARRDDKLYLYRLVADLSEEIGDHATAIRALQAALPIAGEQRTPLLRELMSMAARSHEQKVAFGRRIIGQGEFVPPQVYLDLGQAFLEAKDVVNARKTFRQMSRLPEYEELRRKIAESFEAASFSREALRVYENILTTEGNDLGLLVKVGELHEQTGRDDAAFEVYARAAELLMRRSPLSSTGKRAVIRDPLTARRISTDEFAQHFDRVLAGILATLPEGAAARRFTDELVGRLERDAARAKGDATAERHPRIERRLRMLHRVLVALGDIARADAVDRRLLAAFPEDHGLLARLVRFRLDWGYVISARKLVEASGRPEAEKRGLRLLTGATGERSLPERLSLHEAQSLLLPLLAAGETNTAGRVLERVSVSTATEAERDTIPLVVGASILLERPDLTASMCRQWLTVIGRLQGIRMYQDVEQLLVQARSGLGEAGIKSLIEAIVDQVILQPNTFSWFVQRLQSLRTTIGDLLTRAQVERLIRSRLESGDALALYGMDALLACLDPADLAPVVRSIWSKVPKSQRATLIFDLVRSARSEFDASFSDFLVAAFANAPVDSSPLGSLRLGPDRLVLGLKVNFKTAYGLLEVLRSRGVAWRVVAAARAIVQLELGKLSDAVAAAAEYFGGTESDVRLRSVARRLEEPLLKAFASGERARALLAMFNERGMYERRLAFLERTATPSVVEAAMRGDLAQRAGDGALRARLAGFLRKQGRLADAADVLDAWVREHPKDKGARALLASILRGLGNTARAAELGPAPRPVRRAPRRRVAATMARVIRGRVVRVMTPQARLLRVRQAWDAGKIEDARLEFRKLWRDFGGRRLPPGYALRPVVPRQLWPAERKAAPRPRPGRTPAAASGLPGLFTRPLPPLRRRDAKPPRSVQEVLATKPEGLAEVRRQLRGLAAVQLGSAAASDMFRALAKAESAGQDKAAFLAAQLEAERAGSFGKVGYGTLYAMLEDSSPDALSRAAPTLEALLRNTDPSDAGSTRRLARLFARGGDGKTAAALYRWCAILGQRAVLYGTNQDLLDEVSDQLTGAERERTVAVILSYDNSGRYYPDRHVTLVLRTWRDLVGPERALERAKDELATITDLSRGPMRGACMIAAPMLARAGRLREAIACLEVALCKVDVPAQVGLVRVYDPGVRASDRQLAELLPFDTKGWIEPAAWFAAVADSAAKWARTGRLEPSLLQRILPVVALRLHALGQSDSVDAVLAKARKAADSTPLMLLWVADAARHCGREKLAAEIEAGLLERRAFPVKRIAVVVEHIAELRGNAAAIKVAEAAARWTHEAGLLDRLIVLHEAAGHAEAVARWKRVRAEQTKRD